MSMSKWPSKMLTGSHKDRVISLAWSCDGKRLASGSNDKTARIWTPERDQRTSTALVGHASAVNKVAWHPAHPDIVASVSSDHSVKIWDIRTGKASHTVATPGININTTWSPDGSYLVAGDTNDNVVFIDSSSGTIAQSYKYNVEVNEFLFNHAGDLFLTCMGDGRIEIREFPEIETVYHDFLAHPANCFSLDMDPRGRYLAVGSNDSLVSLWEMRDWICIRTFNNLAYPVRSLGFSSDGEYLASASEEAFIDISAVTTGASVHKLNVAAGVNAIAWHPFSNILAYACDDKGPAARYGPTPYSGNIGVFGM
ncbi:uncharacterized protein L969DRAFT_85743 [Mixia osmundae IAM 14324]|uniref:Uncharacterized protein n=1 Tax=Mixia osmundae (strain CBS 9802 / IAM 14324 / JCM 22182 / KY 12970) TaxID=764103 RepID=G7E631_MIXOS|nr:uncharacterized protein L969DRAFT_85743 [Mixia osmundae IAM 14324]KEI40557.1 hypothetical protein L969DRAFT_85743 [Mixia osmundae IAM 14324]GAA98291.1 hypothetical protein E5Q_04975 [Mixia osmundae IAM 14324]